MFISFLNTLKKIIYIIFILTFLSVTSSDHSLASNHILAVEKLEISKEINLKFSRNKIIDHAFKKAFYRLLSQILMIFSSYGSEGGVFIFIGKKV